MSSPRKPRSKSRTPRSRSRARSTPSTPILPTAAPPAPPAGVVVARAELVPHDAAHAAPPLTADQKRQVAEAVRLGEEARHEAESALTGYGRWLLVNVFGDDAHDAIKGKRANPVWHTLLALAGGPRLRLARASLHLAVQLAAYDKRLNDETFRALDITRKRHLLSLPDEPAMRAAAKHVSALKLSATATQDYVRALLDERDARSPVRMTPQTAATRASRVARLFADKAVLAKWKRQLSELEGAKREGALDELRAVEKAVRELIAALAK